MYKPKPFIWNRGSTRNLATTLPSITENPWRQTSVHIWLLAMCPCPHFQQAVWGLVPAHSLCVPSACCERQAPESCWWHPPALASGTGRSPCAPAWSVWWSSGAGALWSACGSSPSRCRLELPGWAMSAWETRRRERWPGLALRLLVRWGWCVLWGGGQSGCHSPSLTGWSEWRRGRRRCWRSLVLPLLPDLQGNAERCYQPGSPLLCAAAPSSPHLWRSRTLGWLCDDLESRVHTGAGRLKFGACGWVCWSDTLAPQASLWPGEGTRWLSVWWGDAHRCRCFGHSKVLECL